MREFKGTKKEWLVDTNEPWENNKKRKAIDVYFTENGQDLTIATIWDCDEESKADAELIAAAPELLKTLHLVTTELFDAIEHIHGLSSAKENLTIKKADELMQKLMPEN